MSIEIIRLDHIQICIPIGKEELARKFYLNLLNFIEIEKPESLKRNGGFWCQSKEVTLHIGVEDIKETKSKRHVAFIVHDITQARKALEKNGILIRDEIPIPGIDRFSCFDPFHNKIEFLERVGTSTTMRES
ncbi:4-hydroxyphenylpyruvate dioxygenase-like putative hemolysin [Metabacillus crassostreae]|uniref:VOC family protein n=1 Tax=Metabacillus crassostreae TaxID=929098 RepID=UPI00195BE491|nr:VOC family protein [Metabacillus crassostreae]MBM7603565.1 4-hydroxyphenylpyruvate dioxygenase-like putative hemolysin [Metabacillus crassostreae]